MADEIGANDRLIEIELDEASLPRSGSEIEHERRVAIFDLLESNKFRIDGVDAGPYFLRLSIVEERLVFDMQTAERQPVHMLVLSLTPLRRVMKDYFLICETYYQAIRHSTPQQIEAIDMGRRGLHNEGSELLEARLKGKVEIDFDTARRLFTLICALHVRV
jgi:uncharacterized protein (UPF0262 family)